MSDPQPQPTMLDYALDYLVRGWPVFPVCRPVTEFRCMQHGRCSNAGKVPLVKWERFQTELPTEQEVREWWRRDATANIGMATGALSGIIVLDCDGGDARKVALDRGVPPTPTVFTGKPGGVHYHLAHPGFPVANFARKYADLPGIDFRGDGGYVLLPPSHHWRGADYRWVEDTEHSDRATSPDWLLDRIHGRSEAPASTGDHPGIDLVGLLDGVPEGERDDTLWRFACRLRGDDVPLQYAEFMVRQAARACRPSFEEDDAIAKVRRAYAQYSPTLQLIVPTAITEPAPAVETTYPVQSLAELLASNTEDLPQIAEGILWAQRTTWAFSAPGVGKTIFLVALGLHVAAGRDFCGRKVQQMPVLLIEEDCPLSVLSEYVADLADIYQFDLDAIPFYVNKIQGLRLTDSDGLGRVWGAINACPQRPGWLLLDACERLVPSDKFTTKELDPLARLLQQVLGASITPTVIDHTRRPPQLSAKEKANAAPVDPMETLYGARAKQAISDVMLHFSGSPRAGIRIHFAKFRGERPPDIDVRYDGDNGFAVKKPRPTPQTEGQRQVLAWFNGHAQDWHEREAIVAGVTVAVATVDRALKAMVTSGLLRKEGATKGGVRYMANDIDPGFVL